MALLPYASSSKTKVLPEYATDPINPYEGMEYINTLTNQIKVFYGNTWQVVFTLQAVKINIAKGQPIGLMGVTYGSSVT